MGRCLSDVEEMSYVYPLMLVRVMLNNTRIAL